MIRFCPLETEIRRQLATFQQFSELFKEYFWVWVWTYPHQHRTDLEGKLFILQKFIEI